MTSLIREDGFIVAGCTIADQGDNPHCDFGIRLLVVRLQCRRAYLSFLVNSPGIQNEQDL